jgi:phage terminase large subunit-like protein
MGMRADFVEALAALDPGEAEAVVAALSNAEVAQANLFAHWMTAGQAPPAALPGGGAWRTWLIVGGRGFGKTRAGAEWVLARGREGRAETRIALVAGSVDEARRVMVEGSSGLLACALPGDVADWSPSRRELRFASGALASLYSGASAGMLRGPEHDFAWCDEIAKWACAQESWDNLQLGLRRGAAPCAVVTTTPRAGSLVAALAAEPDTVLTGGGSRANPFLPPAHLRAIERRYAGTRRGAEELDGAILTDVEGSLWPATLIAARRHAADPMALAASARRVVVGVDPPASAAGTCGIVVAAALADGGAGSGAGGGYAVLDDASAGGASPEGWAAAVAAAAARWGADRVVAERNQGGDMVRSVLRAAGATLPVKLAHAARGKVARAEPVAALFETGAAVFAGRFPLLEAELTGLRAGGDYAGPGGSPDRADAMVWALTELALGGGWAPRVRGF